jgi:hypothetical protein
MWRRYKLGDWAFSEPKKPKFVSILPTEDVRISVLAAMGMQNPVSAQLQEVIEKAKERVRIQMMGDLFEPPSATTATGKSLFMPPEVAIPKHIPMNVAIACEVGKFEEEMDELLEEMDKMPVEDLEEFEKYVREEISKVDLGYVQYGSLQATLRLLKKFKDKEEFKSNKQNLVKEIEKCKNRFDGSFIDALEELEGAETPERVMEIKRYLLLDLLDDLPLHADTCIYCHMCGSQCDKCDYAHKYGHKECGEAQSSWKKVRKAQDTLKNVIEREYWSEEE